MLRKFALIAALGPVLWLSTAYALSLGDIDVQSRLNQRFSAVIPLSAIDAEDADSIQVQLGSNDDFAKAGIERADYLSSLTFQVKTDGKNPRVVISSNLIAHDPFLNFLLEVRSQGTRLLRQYTVLLDPPNYAEPSVPIAANAAPAESAAPEAAQGNPPAQSAPASPAAGVTGEENPAAAPVHTQYGPVKPGETLWSIAAKLRSDPSITMNQVLLAIYNSNRRAFEPRLEVRKGSMLEVPTLDQMRSVSAVEATQRVERLSGKHAHAQKPRSRAQRHVKPAKAAEAAAPAPAPASAPVPAQAAPGPSAENKPDTGMQVQNQPAPAPAVESTKPVS
ncbi:MAG: type IV pilus assembly protein FimV, partial [Stenotrophobium sp.]